MISSGLLNRIFEKVKVFRGRSSNTYPKLALLSTLPLWELYLMILEANSVEAGIDWITATVSKREDGTPRKESSLEKLYASLRVQEDEQKVKFGGYTGLSDANGLKIGTRERGDTEDVILVASGARANEVAIKVAGLEDVRITRLDLQMTVGLPKVREVASSLRIETLEKRASGEKAHRRKMTYYSSDTGDTLYVGERSSRDKCIRIYDKGGLLGLPLARVWRFEVEYHRALAGQVLKGLTEKENATALISSTVASEMAKVGLIVQGNSKVKVPRPEPREMDTEKMIVWLEGCVKPVLVKLACVGLLDEGLEALGLQRKAIKALDEIYDSF